MVPPAQLEGRSLFDQRAEELMTHTGSLRGSFVSEELKLARPLCKFNVAEQSVQRA